MLIVLQIPLINIELLILGVGLAESFLSFFFYTSPGMAFPQSLTDALIPPKLKSKLYGLKKEPEDIQYPQRKS